MIKVQGLEKLQRQLEEARKAFDTLDGEIAKVRVEPGNPASARAAICQLEAIIDKKASPYRENPLVAPIVEQLKKRCREHIAQRSRG